MLSREDRNLLKNYGSTEAEDQKDKEIEKAFREDTKVDHDDLADVLNKS